MLWKRSSFEKVAAKNRPFEKITEYHFYEKLAICKKTTVLKIGDSEYRFSEKLAFSKKKMLWKSWYCTEVPVSKK